MANTYIYLGACFIPNQTRIQLSTPAADATVQKAVTNNNGIIYLIM